MSLIADTLDLADWRRRVAALYAEVRGADDPAEAWRFWRGERERLIREHPQSPLDPATRAAFRGLRFFDYDPELRFAVALEPTGDDTPRDVELGLDGRLTLRPIARTSGLAPRLGGELTVFWITGYGGGIFLPFADASNGEATYGGGRYLLDGIKGADLGTADGRLICDFNFAYNPSCVYADAWVCPLSPPENRLPAAVRAGELKEVARASG